MDAERDKAIRQQQRRRMGDRLIEAAIPAWIIGYIVVVMMVVFLFGVAYAGA